MKFLILLLSTLLVTPPIKEVSAMEVLVNLQKFSNPNQVIGFQRTCQPKGNCRYIFEMCLSTQLYDFGCTFGQRARKSVNGGEEIDLSTLNPALQLRNVKATDFFFTIFVYAERLNTAPLIRFSRFIKVIGGKEYKYESRTMFASLQFAVEIKCPSGYRGNRCDQAICRNGCQHGFCRQPYQCSCRRGWVGFLCDRCDKGRYCKHGTCNGQNQCNCFPGYTGTFCENRICSVSCNVEHGNCIGNLSKCSCDIGWKGDSCNECQTSNGCSDVNVKLKAIETTSKTATIWWDYNGNPANRDSTKRTVIQYITEDKFRRGNINSGRCGTCQLTAPLARSPIVILSLARHTKYVLRVAVLPASGNSEESVQYGDWQHFTTKGHPGLPVVFGTEIEHNRVNISYGNISHNGGYDFRDYFVYLQYTLANDAKSCGQDCRTIRLSNLNGNVLINGLTETTKYMYRFIAENPVGESTSQWQTIITKGKPGKANIGQIDTTPNTATVSWNRVPFNGNYPLHEVTYQLEYQRWDSNVLPSDSACRLCSRNNLNSAASRHAVISLLVNTTYSVRIIATNKAGSSYSKWKIFKTKGLPQQPAIRNFVTTINVATVSWIPITENGGYPLSDVTYFVEYQIYSRSTNVVNGDLCRSCQSIRASNVELISIPNLHRNTTYMVRIVAENGAGRSYSDFRFVATKGVPGMLTPIKVDPNVFAVNVTWNPVSYTGGYQPSEITYVLEYSERNSSSDASITGPCSACTTRGIPFNSRTYQLSGLKGNTAYILRVIARNAVGPSYGPWVETITKDDAYSVSFPSRSDGGGAYVKISHTPQSVESTYIVSLRFKPAGTTVKDGLIFFLNNGYDEIRDQTSLLIYLHEKKLEALFVERDFSVMVQARVDVEPENWYYATANVSQETLTVTVNGRTQSGNPARTLRFSEFFNYAPYIGGVFDYSFLPVSASSKVKGGFYGCIKRLSINTINQNMENAAQNQDTSRCPP